jgi:hypothetical protein
VVRVWDAARFGSVQLDGRTLPQVDNEEALRQLPEGWHRTRDGTRITVVFPEGWTFALRFLPHPAT